jgi:hypothetical protein
MAQSVAAWNEDLPCKNPNCKSQGRPHQNCKCYQSAGVYASGGEVEMYCRQNKPHNSDCEYYAEGGSAMLPEPTQPTQQFNPAQHGSNILDTLIKGGIINGGDSVGQSMLDDSGDSQGALASHIADVGAHGLLGLGKKNDAASKLKDIQRQKVSQKANDFLTGIGSAANNTPVSGSKSVKDGADFYNKASKFSVDTNKLNDQLSALIGRPINSKNRKYIVPAIFKSMSSGNTDNLLDAVDHAESVGSGSNDIDKSIESLFGGETQNFEPNEGKRDKLKEYVENGGMNDSVQQAAQPAQQFAGGGEVKENKAPDILHGSDAVAAHYPNQAMLMGLAKGRVNNYLNSIRPLPSVNGLPFDTQHKDKHKEKEYDKALELANHPLSIMNHVKDSTLIPGHLNHFKGMYPELHDHISKKLTERIIKNRLEGENAPPHKVRQAMSLFTGAPMDSSFTPQSIQAAQSVFMAPQATQQQPPQKKKKGTSPLTKLSENYQTRDQASEARQRNS